MPETSPQAPGQHPRRWKRAVVFVLLLLAGGAVVNVAVSWCLPTGKLGSGVMAGCKVTEDVTAGVK